MTMVDHALAYAERGWRVHPLRPDATPYLKAWQERATTDADTITGWWTSHPEAGIGIATGPTSGIWVLDVDTDRRRGKTGDETLAELEDAYGPLPDTYEVITGSGGRHLYFAWDRAHDVRNSASGTLGAHLDVRGDGGYVVAPPTPHRLYTTAFEVEAGAPDHPTDAPGWLYALITHTPEPPTDPRPTVTTRLDGDLPGDLWAASIDWANDLLIPDGWTLHHIDHSGEQHWTRPGKDRREGTSATLDYRGSDTLKVFSSSVGHLGLQPEGTYSKFGYLTATRFGGDFAAAARSLRDAGWKAPDPDAAALGLTSITSSTPSATTALDPTDWPTPTPLPERPEPTPLPLDALPTWITDHARAVAEQIQVPVDLPAIIALGALSAVLNGHVLVQATDGWVDGVNLYTAVLGRAGIGKSPAARHMLAPARDFEARQRERNAAAIREHEVERRALEKRMKDAEERYAKLTEEAPEHQRTIATLGAQLAGMVRPPTGEMFAGDATPEALVELLANNAERGAVIDTEGTLLSIIAGRYSSKANTEFVLKCWSGDTHNHRRVGRVGDPIHLREPRLAIVLALQPKRWLKVLEDRDLADVGLPDRFMVSYPAPRKPRPDLRRQSLDTLARAAYEQTFGAIAERVATWARPATLTLSEDAIDAYDAMRSDHVERTWEGGDLATLGEFIAKLEGSVLRVAAILHLAHGHDIAEAISGETMGHAVALGAYWTDHRATSTVDSQAVEDGAEVLRWIGEHELATFTSRELARGIYRFRTTDRDGQGGAERAVVALELLADHGYVRSGDDWPIGESRRGVKRVIDVNPAVLEGGIGPRHPATDGEMMATEGVDGGGVHDRTENRDTPRHPRQGATEGSGVSADSHGGWDGVTGVAGVTSKAFLPPPSLPEGPEGADPHQHRDTRDTMTIRPVAEDPPTGTIEVPWSVFSPPPAPSQVPDAPSQYPQSLGPREDHP